jgi:catechol 2,3-dioxygenase-like lactoylglutathione lyase family enzyme
MPGGMLGMRHVALFAQDLEACLYFYVELLGMQVEWQPDADNYYLTSGSDNLALHRTTTQPAQSGQRLDHIGFIIKTPTDVDSWHSHLAAHSVKILQPPKTHRDGARSFYCADPAGNMVQFIYHPPISGQAGIK